MIRQRTLLAITVALAGILVACVDTGVPKPGEPSPGPSPGNNCKTCGRDADRNFICKDASTGSNECPEIVNGSGGRSCSYTLNCSSGFGFSGGLVAFQGRAADYFHTDVQPNLIACWATLRETGELTLRHDFRRSDRGWIPAELEVVESSLSDKETRQAVECMRLASDGTRLRVGRDDAEEGPLSLYWTWPVPAPAPE